MKKNKEVWVVFIIGIFTALLFMKGFQYTAAIKSSLDMFIWVVGGLGFVVLPVLFYSMQNMKKESEKI
jgi:uncharacterized protein YebE (UPF0316 family)